MGADGPDPRPAASAAHRRRGSSGRLNLAKGGPLMGAPGDRGAGDRFRSGPGPGASEPDSGPGTGGPPPRGRRRGAPSLLPAAAPGGGGGPPLPPPPGGGGPP